MEIWIATNNQKKALEYQKIFSPYDIKVKTLIDLENEINIEETSDTYEGNAILKAQTLADMFDTTWLADDSGFEVDALDKEPGVYSARFLGEKTTYEVKNQYIIDKLKDEKNRKCRFVCVIALCKKNKKPELFRGEVEGLVSFKIEGENGFGYDPIFYYPSLNKTFSQLSESKKNEISHRGLACRKLMNYLNENII
ncbi:MAG: RdgB/HAM1 family non-canonical purine NTP pyrophosphatase [Anaerorhabdus sp.]